MKKYDLWHKTAFYWGGGCFPPPPVLKHKKIPGPNRDQVISISLKASDEGICLLVDVTLKSLGKGFHHDIHGPRKCKYSMMDYAAGRAIIIV